MFKFGFGSKVIDVHLHEAYLKVKTQTIAFLDLISCSVKQVSILSVSILAPPLPPLINACNLIPVPLNIVNANQKGTID